MPAYDLTQEAARVGQKSLLSRGRSTIYGQLRAETNGNSIRTPGCPSAVAGLDFDQDTVLKVDAGADLSRQGEAAERLALSLRRVGVGRLDGVAHGRQDVFGAGPRFTHELGEQPTFPGNYGPTVDEYLELSARTFFKLDGRIQFVTDQGSETRGLLGNGVSGVAADDSYVHGLEYSSAARLA